MLQLGYEPSKADPNLWFIDCKTHYEYVATYVDDLLVFAKRPMDLIETLKKRYILKGVGEPEYYLGADMVDLRGWKQPGVTYGLGAKTYIKRIVAQVEKESETTIIERNTPLVENYHPELDESPLLSSGKASFYRSLTGALNWVVTLCRADIAHTNQLMARYNSIPREGHLEAVIRVIGYLKKWNKGLIVFDPRPLPIPEHIEYEHHDTWRQHYPGAKEEIPPKMPTPRGCAGEVTVYVDADHATDLVTRRSTTGMVMFVNSTPIRWISKRQSTVESSTHGAELTAMKIATEAIIEMRYKLRMLGIPIEKPTTVLCDNNSVVLNVSLPSSVLKKKHNAVAYHRVREAVAARVIVVWYVRTFLNLADLFTKILGKLKHHRFSKPLIFSSSPTHETEFEIKDTSPKSESSGEATARVTKKDGTPSITVHSDINRAGTTYDDHPSRHGPGGTSGPSHYGNTPRQDGDHPQVLQQKDQGGSDNATRTTGARGCVATTTGTGLRTILPKRCPGQPSNIDSRQAIGYHTRRGQLPNRHLHEHEDKEENVHGTTVESRRHYTLSHTGYCQENARTGPWRKHRCVPMHQYGGSGHPGVDRQLILDTDMGMARKGSVKKERARNNEHMTDEGGNVRGKMTLPNQTIEKTGCREQSKSAYSF